jgi:hypothetical protein
MVQLVHFTRILGCKKKIPECEKRNSRDFTFYPNHYRYFGKVKEICYNTTVIVIPCNNCDKQHKIGPNECELILDSKNNVYAVSLRLKKNMYNFFISDEIYLKSILTDSRILYNFILYYNKDKFFKTYVNEEELSSGRLYLFKKWVMDNNIPMNYGPSLHPLVKTTKYLSVFCPSPEKDVTIICNNDSEFICNEHGTLFYAKVTTTVKYGWSMFCICEYQKYPKWFICTTPLNEILQVSCNKPHFQMYIINDKKIFTSLLNLSYSSLHQNNFNIVMNQTKSTVPTTLCQQAPPCYFYHLLSTSSSCRNSYSYYPSSHISDW